jgi:glycine/D-amino acid oxidase-like deaminating enzyme
MKDFLIIGGGIAGLSAAARLAPLGSTLLLETENALGYHASGRSAALYEANYGAPATVELNKASRAYFDQGGYLMPRGFMVVGAADDAATFEAARKSLKCDPINFAEAQDIVPILAPDHCKFAAYTSDAYDIDTDRLLQDFAKDARANGADILTDQPVTSIQRTTSGWNVTTPNGTYQTRTIVNAAGAWADTIAEMAGVAPVGIQPCRRSMARIPAPGGHDVSSWPMVIEAHESWYAKPDAGKLLVSPADEDPQAPYDAWADDMVLAEGIARYQPFVTEEVTRVESSWAGLRSFAPDRNLVIGPDPAEPAFIWLAGQGGSGIQSAPGYSQYLADVIAGRPTEIDAAFHKVFNPARFA